MCDFSLMMVASRPAKVGDKLETRNFGSGTTGLCSPDDINTAVCVLPGTELAFDKPVACKGADVEHPKVAIFRQIEKDQPHRHHDCIEFPNGEKLLLTFLEAGQTCTVLQLPAAPKNAEEAKEQERLAIVA